MEKGKFLVPEGTKMETTIELSERLIDEAEKILADHAPLEGPVCIPSKGNEVNAILSPKSDDLIPLKQLESNGVPYYLGIPKN